MMTLVFLEVTYPNTDHGLTVANWYWFEDEDGNQAGPTCPAPGYTDRFRRLPGDENFIHGRPWELERDYTPGMPTRTVKETREGYWRVSPVVIERMNR